MSSNRKSISKKVRFDVFKRDNFTCQYCGSKAPDVILEIDHIKPVSKGGTNNILNLITSCYDCNRGKSNKELNDNQTLSKELKQMELLSERKQQIEMMFKWQNELLKQDKLIIDKIENFLDNFVNQSLTDYGKELIGKIVGKYSIEEIVNGIKETHKSYGYQQNWLNNLPKMLASIRLQTKKPYMKKLFYLRGILRNRLSYYDNKKALYYLVKWYEDCNVSLDELEMVVKTCEDWNEFLEKDVVFTYED